MQLWKGNLIIALIQSIKIKGNINGEASRVKQRSARPARKLRVCTARITRFELGKLQ